MGEFSVTRTAFAGVGLLARKPLALAGWALCFIAFFALFSALMLTMFADEFADLNRMAEMSESGAEPDPSVVFGLLGRIAPFYVFSLVAMLAFYAILYTSIFRAVLRPDEGSPFHLGIGAAELRMVLLMIVMGAFFLAIYIALIIGGLVLGMIAGALGAALKASEMVVGASTALIVFAIVCAGLLIFAVRFSLAGPATYFEGGLRVFRSWSLTKGRFWKLLGAYALITVPIFVAMIVIAMTLFVIVFGVDFEPGVLRETMQPSVQLYTSPGFIAYALGMSILYAIIIALMAAPAASAYRQLAAAP